MNSPVSVTITFPAPQANFPALFDTLPILSAISPLKEKAVLGPFVVSDYKPGAELLLKRNPNYWKHDSAGHQLPYLDSVRLYFQSNREIEYTRFHSGEIQLMNRVDPAIFNRLSKEAPADARSGASSDVEFLWFNQMPNAPMPVYKREWFRSRNFRQAISEAINRDDISRIVYFSHAQPALGPFSNANLFWFDQTLKPQIFDSKSAVSLLQSDGFQLKGGTLYDHSNNPVEFSVVTFGAARERTAVLIQQDLKAIGIKLNIVPLEMNSLIERIKKNFQYEAALLGLSNLDLDPNGQMNVWPSTSGDHAWNPNQKTPATPWESEIDRLMQEQSTSTNLNKRKQDFDRVQQIVRQQLPYIYLVNKNTLSAVSSSLRGVEPAPLFPEILWNVDRIAINRIAVK